MTRGSKGRRTPAILSAIGLLFCVTPPAAAQADAAALLAAAQERLDSIRKRTTLQQDERDIQNLQAAYGYYLDRFLWDEMADMFAADGEIEIGHRGVYVGQDRVREFLHSLGPEGPRYGVLHDHLEDQVVVHVAEDGLSAKVRARSIIMAGTWGESGVIGDAIYENEVVKEDGVWKFKTVRMFPIFTADYDLGWAESAIRSPGPSETLPPDRPPTMEYGEYPTYFVPPFHYPNPATGEPVQYRPEDQ